MFTKVDIRISIYFLTSYFHDRGPWFESLDPYPCYILFVMYLNLYAFPCHSLDHLCQNKTSVLEIHVTNQYVFPVYSLILQFLVYKKE